MDLLPLFKFLGKPGLTVVFGVDVRKDHTLAQDFLRYRDGVSMFHIGIAKENIIYLLRHDHSCIPSDAIFSSPGSFRTNVLEQAQSSRCSCSSVDHNLWANVDTICQSHSGAKFVVLLVCARSGDLAKFVQLAANYMGQGYTVACINIGGAPNFSSAASPGFYFNFPNVEQFYQAMLRSYQSMLAVDKPVVNVRRVGSRDITFDLASSTTKDLDCYSFDVANDNEGNFFTVGKTSTQTFNLKSTPQLEIKPNTSYTVRVVLKLKDGRVSDYVEITKIMTLYETVMIRKLRENNILESEIQRMKILLKEEMIPEGKHIGISHYKYIVFGDIGAGKSSFLNTVMTAYRKTGGYVSYFPVGTSDKKSTTIRLATSTLTDNLKGIDVPGVDGENYDSEKIRNLIEGNFPEKAELDESGWTAKLLPVSERKVSNMIHMAFFLVPIDCLLVKSAQEKYKRLRECFISYKKYNLTGIQPFLIITKADTYDTALKEDKKKIYDDNSLRAQQTAFCKATGFTDEFTFFIANYLGGNDFEQDPVVDYLGLYIVTSALVQAQQNIRLLADNIPDLPSPIPTPQPQKWDTEMDIGISQNDEIIGTVTVKPEETLQLLRNIITRDGLEISGNYIFLTPEKKKAEEKSSIKSIIISPQKDPYILIGQATVNFIDISTKEMVGELQGFDPNQTLSTLRALMIKEGIPDGWTNFSICSGTGAPLTLKQEQDRFIKDNWKDGAIFLKNKK
eukprot:TRINITY_DN8846_c2_g1_i1.p1 TRINITY_DN8846_c2_g1~~TRINITY_DN8846_c2_g1_i1.p1  ORF type:complete len:764 (+),score=173.88 TRINITY_DN8846_c2_g1_i1:96-2294(+)